jgi:hypothetical protein
MNKTFTEWAQVRALKENHGSPARADEIISELGDIRNWIANPEVHDKIMELHQILVQTNPNMAGLTKQLFGAYQMIEDVLDQYPASQRGSKEFRQDFAFPYNRFQITLEEIAGSRDEDNGYSADA